MEQSMEKDQLVSPRQVMSEFAIAYQTVRLWVSRGKLTPVARTVGGHARFARAEVDALKAIRQGQKPPVAPPDPLLERISEAIEPTTRPTKPIDGAQGQSSDALEKARLAAAYGHGLIENLERLLDEEVLKQIGIRRVELFFRVWSAPMAHVAMRLGLKKHVVIHVCKECDVPTPPQGYWQTSIDRRAFRMPQVSFAAGEGP